MSLYMGWGAPIKADVLLEGETQGFAMDATSENGSVSVKDTTTPSKNRRNQLLNFSNLLQSGTSPKLTHWNDGTLRWSQHNLLLRSEEFNTSWTLSGTATVSANSIIAPNGTLTADKIIEPNASASPGVTSTIPFVTGITYTISLYAKSAGESRYLEFDGGGLSGVSECPNFNLDAGTVSLGGTSTICKSATITAVGNGWYRCSAVITTTATSNLRIALSNSSTDHAWTAYAGNGTSGIYIWGAHLNRGAILQAYHQTTTAAWYGIPQQYDSSQSLFGMYIEQAATNLLLRSEEVDNASWTKSNYTISANATTAPDESLTADQGTNATTNASYQQDVVCVTLTNYVLSFYVKASTSTQWVFIRASNTASTSGIATYFDIINGVTGAAQIPFGTGWTANGQGIEYIGNGWYRCYCAVNTNGTGLRCQFKIGVVGDTNSTSVSGAVAYTCGMQAELGTVPSTYIPTGSATATRAADNVNCLTSTYPHSATEGTIVVWAKTMLIDWTTTGPRWITLSDGTGTEVIAIAAVETDTPDQIALQIIDATAQVTAATANTGPVSASGNKVAAFYKLNDSGILGGGGLEQVDTVCTMPTVTSFQFGYRSDVAARELNGYIHQVTYIPRRLTQTEMQTRTT